MECWQLFGIVCCCFVVFLCVFFVDFLHVNKSSSQKKKKKIIHEGSLIKRDTELCDLYIVIFDIQILIKFQLINGLYFSLLLFFNILPLFKITNIYYLLFYFRDMAGNSVIVLDNTISTQNPSDDSIWMESYTKPKDTKSYV